MPLPTPVPPRPRRPLRIATAGTLGALGVTTAVLIGVGTAGASPSTVVGTATAETGPGGGGTWPGYGSGSSGPGGFGTGSSAYGSGGLGGSAGGGSPTGATTTATADQLVGLVTIDTVLGYQNGEAAGTGMVLTSGGEILTNNHVIEGATGITVTVVRTGTRYHATVVGTDPTDDVAVLQLSDASGLQVADFGKEPAELGDAVTAVGNAGGTGTPSAASGTVTAVEQSITATDESGAGAEQLSGLLETDADVVAGDSGGPLYDTGSGQIVGMDTAASNGGDGGDDVVGYAIPVSTALSIAGQITRGVDDATVHQGYPAFLGISVDPAGTGGAAVAGVLSGGPAEQGGLTTGSVVTAVGGATVGSADDLTTALAGRAPGDTVAVTWTDASGATHTAQIPLAAGPAD